MGVCKSDGVVMLVQEYVSGGSLHRILQNKAIELLWPTRVKMALEIAQALLFLHSRNILHRDLKAENVLVEKGSETAGRPSFGRCKVRSPPHFIPSLTLRPYHSHLFGTLKLKYSSCAPVMSVCPLNLPRHHSHFLLVF